MYYVNVEILRADTSMSRGGVHINSLSAGDTFEHVRQ